MPKVPEEQSATFNTSNIPGVQFPYRQEFGKVGQAAERFGSDMGQAASTGSEIYNEVQRQQAISQSENLAVQHKVDSDSYIRNLKTASPDGFIHENGDQNQPIVQNDDQTPRTITQEFHSWSDDRYQQDQDNLSPMGAAMYRQKMLPEIGARMSQLNNDAHTMQLNDAEQKREQGNQTVFKEFDAAPYDKQWGLPNEPGNQSRPDLSKFSDYASAATLGLQQRGGILDPKTGQLTGGLMNQTEINTANTKQLNEYGDRWLNSNLTKIMEDEAHNGPHASQDIQNLLDVVHGRDAQSQSYQAAGKVTPSTALSAEQQTNWEKKLIGMIPTAQSIDTSEFKLYEKNYISAAEQGQYKLGNTNPSRDNLINWGQMFLKTGQWSQADFIQHMSDWTAGETRGSLAGRNFDNLSTAQQHAMTDQNTGVALKTLQQEAQMRGMSWTADIGKQVANEVSARMVAPINEMDKQKKDDMAGFMAGYDSLGQPRNGVAKQVSNLDFTNPAGIEKSGLIPKYLQSTARFNQVNFGSNQSFYRPISKDNSSTLGASLQAMSATQAGQSVDNLKNAYGPSFGKLMDTMINEKSLPENWRIYGTIPTVQGRVAQISADQGLAQTKELYEIRTGDKFDELRATVGKAYKDDIDARLGAAPLDRDQRSYTAALTNTAVNAVAQMRLNNPGMDEPTAIQNSKAELFKNYPVPTKIGNSATVGGWKMPWGSGPQITTEFSPGLSDTQKGIIQQNLSHAMTEQGLTELGAAAPKPTPGKPDFSDKFIPMAARNMVHINHVQGKDGPGYTFDTTGENDDGKSDGSIIHIMDKNGAQLFIPDSQLLIPRNATKPFSPAKTYHPPLYQPKGFTGG